MRERHAMHSMHEMHGLYGTPRTGGARAAGIAPSGARGGRPAAPHPPGAPRSAPVTTMLTADERLRVDAAGQGLYWTLHRDTLDDVIPVSRN